MANAGKLLWAQISYLVVVWVQVYHWLPEKCCCLRASLTSRICVHCRTPSYYHPAFSGYAYINGNRVLELSLWCWTSWLSILSYNIDQVLTTIVFVAYRLLPRSTTTHAKLLTCYGYMMATWLKATRILRRSQSVLSYTGDLFFPLLSVCIM